MQSALSHAGAYLTAIVWALACVSTAPAVAASTSNLDVLVEIVEGEIRADVSLFVRAPRQRVWDVITDYERAPEFMRSLQVSKILTRAGDTVRLLQKDEVRFGPFTFPVETVKEIRLSEPRQTESRLVSGSLEKYNAKMELVQEAGGTRILYRSQAIPGSALALLAGEGLIRRETEERFKQLRAEILRREHIAANQ